MTFRDRIEWMFRMALLVFILAAAAFLSAVTAMRFAIQGREVDMPSLVSKSSEDAQALLASRGLQLKIVDRVYSSLPINAVVRQSPPAGEHMKVSQDAHVVLSLGPQNITTPALGGHSSRMARIELLQAGLQLGEVTACYIPGVAADTVVQQDPPAGTLAASPRVDLLISTGPPAPAYVMPTLVGMQQPDADHAIDLAGLKISRVSYQPAPQSPPGVVIAQTPLQGSRVASDTPIAMVISQ